MTIRRHNDIWKVIVLGLLLIVGGGMNMMWATKVTYHILTLPINSSTTNMKAAVNGYRLEALKVVVDNQTAVELPAQFKSPLATNFRYYATGSVEGHGTSAINLYDYGPNKGVIYKVKGVDTADSETRVTEGTTISGSTAEYYVIYSLIDDEDNEIAMLDGTVNYNIAIKNKGFLALNRGRNNRPAVVPKGKVDPEILASKDFMKIDAPGSGITTYWSSGDNKNTQSLVEKQFHFIFHFEGQDPYNIVVRTSYDRDTTYIEKNDNLKPDSFVYKWYKESSLFAVGTANAYLASDEHRRYNVLYNKTTYPTNPTNLVEGKETGYITRRGNYHGQTGVIWGTFALLYNTEKTGYVFIGTRTVDTNGATPTPSGDKYNFLKFDNNNLTFGSMTIGDASKNYSTEGIYPVEKVTFKVPTPFYNVTATEDHIVSVSDLVSQYTVQNDPIVIDYLPAELRRKYCSFNGKFYSDAARTHQITYFSEANKDEVGDEGYQVYLGYDVSASIPFQAITPAGTYSAETWKGATWYEITDAESTQIDGMKLKYDDSEGQENFKNNGADGDYAKTSEFAFIGDPYELQVVYRNATSGATPYYVGAMGTPPTSPTNLSINTLATAGFVWEIPYEAPTSNFLLQKYKGEGNWCWTVTRPDPVDISYSTKAHTYNVATANAQAVTFNVSGLTNDESYYITVTAGGTNADQVTVPSEKIYVEAGGKASFVAAIKSRGGSNKTFTLTIQLYNGSDVAQGSASVITVNQNSATISSSVVQYSTAGSTRMKVMELPKFTYMYHIVDKSGAIAVKASASQTIFSPLSNSVSATLQSSLPSNIVSPYLVGETLTFYDSYTDRNSDSKTSRLDFHNPTPQTDITELPAVNNQNIYVTYTTEALNGKPIMLNEDQEFNVALNGQYLYFDSEHNAVKSTETPTDLKAKEFLWKLRNRDPYAMLVDNMGAREYLPDVADQTETVTIYNDNGGTSSESRQKGAWIQLASLPAANERTLSFTTTRGSAQRFIAKASTAAGVYEVMVATGESVDASTTYYNIGCPTAEVKIYDQAHYAHGNDALKFRLEQSIGYTYHLIDKSNHELLTHTSQNADLALPEEYQSPLVGAYHFYAKNNINIVGNVYTVEDPAAKLGSLSDLEVVYSIDAVASDADKWGAKVAPFKQTGEDEPDMLSKIRLLEATGEYIFKIGESTYKKVTVTRGYRGRDIYVTYDVNDLIGFNNTGKVNDHPYLLRFLEPYAAGYYLEDGNDNLTAEPIQAVYPYCNGDGNLNVYGAAMRDEQMNGGSSTRSRWVWYFESITNDPYHVKIHSRNTISYGGINYPTYLETYAVHFEQAGTGVDSVVTGGILSGIAGSDPTEYMIVGAPGKFKLLTTKEISANGVAARRKVTSFEQYWKTYNMVKLDVLGISKSTNAYSDDPTTWEVPDDPASYRATLTAKNWHSYDVYANAVRWNGYNDKSDGEEKKVVEKLEHWFQTFSMGNGTFDIESADIPPVLILLDRHGWEIMRKPLPAAHYPEGEDELAALRAYDSPLVDRYYFYSNATKATGCHKYTLRLNDKGEERDQIKQNGVHYSSESLGDLPLATATGVMSNGVLNDQFVIYTVKEEYEEAYQYTFTDNGNNTCTESGTPSKYLILHNARFARDNAGTGDRISYLSKPIHEATKPVGGCMYDMIISPWDQPSQSNVSTNVDESPKDGVIDDKNLWKIQPNLNIDKEMGIKWGTSNDITGAEPLSEYATKLKYKNKTDFDPYNIQLQNAANGKYLTTHMTTTKLESGIMVGDYTGSGGRIGLTLEDWVDVSGRNTSVAREINGEIVDEGYDHTNLQVTNQTFMAVKDANGNMQLMPRFDHTKRINVTLGSSSLTTVQDPVDHAKATVTDNNSMGPQTFFFVRMQRYIYHIIDNNGREALRFTRGGDDYPTVTDHFKSPLAKDFTFYKDTAIHGKLTNEADDTAWKAASPEFQRTITNPSVLDSLLKLLPEKGTYQFKIGTRGVFTYKSVEVTTGLLEQQITGSLAAAHYAGVDCDVYVRYSYDEDADLDGDRILQGQWFTVQLDSKDLKCGDDQAIVPTDGTGVSLFEGTSKPEHINAEAKAWQWKFLATLADPTSDYYEEPDPYAVNIFNRKGNYTNNPTTQPNAMAVGIKVPNNVSGTDRFALLSHPSGGYALAVAKKYAAGADISFLNGGSMSTSVAATTADESGFTYKVGSISDDAQVRVNDEVEFHYTYYVINNANKLAITAGQNAEDANSHGFAPYLPDTVQTPLLNLDDFLYYGFARYDNNNTPDDPKDDTYSVIPQTILYTLSGLYDDVVYVRYKPYNVDKTSFKIPNEKAIVSSKVARGSGSQDVSMNIKGELPYNIIWENDNMMKSADNTAISDGGSHALSGDDQYVWYFTGDDPYALKIKHRGGNYVDGTATLTNEAGAKEFMLLKRTGYDYGVLQVTGATGADAFKKLTGFGGALTADAVAAPTKFIIFGLSVHDLIYHLIIAKTCTKEEEDDEDLDASKYVDISYREGGENTYTTSYVWSGNETKRIYGSTQRDLTAVNTGEGTHYAGEKYQLGETISWGGNSHTYSHHAGTISIGDNLRVPNVFYRPNCTFEYYIEGVYNTEGTESEDDLDNRFKGLKLEKLMSAPELIGKTVVVNIVYKFNDTLATNSGLDFVRSKEQNLWYTFETPNSGTPYLAHYTNAWGLQAMPGRETRYTNDYLWTPLGDVYGFKMYNRYMLKNSGGTENVMTMNAIAEGKNLYLAVPGTSLIPEGETGAGDPIPVDYAIFELVTGDKDGYFRVHPVANTKDQTQFYVRRSGTDFAVLSETPSDWMFGLDMTLLEPYYERAGYVGGLTAEGKTAYETAVASGKITNIQNVVYNDANIVQYKPGYYRLHNQPGVSGISPVRYASGYLHETEKTAWAESKPIPMHFYSKAGVAGTFDGENNPLESGFTITSATQGEIPIDSTEMDPSTIFYFEGPALTSEQIAAGNVVPTSKMRTQGLYVAANANGDAANGTTTLKKQRAVMVDGFSDDSDDSNDPITFSLMDIGGAVLLIHDGAAPATRRYLNYDQSVADSIYDLRFYHESPTDDAKWCMKPVQKTATAGNGEMPLVIATNNGGDGYYYATFYAPFDVLLPADAAGKTYNAYICKKWYNEGVNPNPVPASGGYGEGKLVPAGTPVIIRVKDESGQVTLTLPNPGPSAPLTSCILKGSYLEGLLEEDANRKVYTMGVPFTSEVSEDDDDPVIPGDITAPRPEFANTGVGFYINATPNKEINPLEAMWKRNNRYVLHNKVYYRAEAGGGGGAPDGVRDVEFVPVLFGDDDEGQPRKEPDGNEQTDAWDGGIYDLLGRKVATAAEVADGTWRQRLTPGIYITKGKKIYVGM